MPSPSEDHEQSATTLARARRTTHFDVSRCTEAAGDLEFRAYGRDVLLAPNGSEVPMAQGAVSGALSRQRRHLVALTVDGVDPGSVAPLCAHDVAIGYRKRLASLLATEVVLAGSVTHQLLDELPVLNLITRYVIRRSAQARQVTHSGHADRIGVCAGWRPGGAAAVSVLRTGQPAQSTGPPAVPLEELDPDAVWHAMPDLPPGSVRRVRSLDVTRTPTGGVAARAWFRDIAVTEGGENLVIRQYALTCGVDGAGTVTRLDVDPQVLPYDECFAAPGGTAVLIGRPVAELEPAVRSQLRGVSSCTHLNDQLRSFIGLSRLLPALAAERSSDRETAVAARSA